MRIFLFGFMGAGKSWWGQKLAQQINYPFIDLDTYIEKNAKQSIASIFTKKGERYFRKLESDCLREMRGYDEVVVALGGGTPCFDDNLSWIKQYGKSIYIKVKPDILFERLKEQRHKRPLIAGLTDDGIDEFIAHKLKEREKYYLQADHIIEPDNITLKELVEQIMLQ